MKIDPEHLLKDAKRLRKTQDDIKSQKPIANDIKRIRVTLDDIGVSLKSHQQTIAKLQLENIGLEQVEKNLDQLLKQNPADFDMIKQAKNEMSTTF